MHAIANQNQIPDAFRARNDGTFPLLRTKTGVSCRGAYKAPRWSWPAWRRTLHAVWERADGTQAQRECLYFGHSHVQLAIRAAARTLKALSAPSSASRGFRCDQPLATRGRSPCHSGNLGRPQPTCRSRHWSRTRFARLGPAAGALDSQRLRVRWPGGVPSSILRADNEHRSG